jgi:hypothetical protein
MTPLVLAADAQSGAGAGGTAKGDGPMPPGCRAIRNGMRATTRTPWRPAIFVAVAPMRATGLRRSEDLHAVLKHGEVLGAV